MKSINLFSEFDSDDLYSLYKKYPNWYELGKNVKSYFNDIRIENSYPNDYECGKAISNYFLDKK